MLEQARADAQASADRAHSEAGEVMSQAEDHLKWGQDTVRRILDEADLEVARVRRETHQELEERVRSRRQLIQTALARAAHRARSEREAARAESERLRAQAEAVLTAAQTQAERTTAAARDEAERTVLAAKETQQAAEERAARRLEEADKAARLVRERTASEIERLQRETHESHRQAREELVQSSTAARADADRVREEARAMLDRARSEVAALASRREDITKQLGHLSGVIDALAVPERPAPTGAQHQDAPDQPDFSPPPSANPENERIHDE
jgi:hypothetical protein